MNSSRIIQYSQVFKVLSHPIRYAILVLLNQHDCTVKELCQELQRRQSNISQHLQILRKSGLLSFKCNGRQRIYTLNQNQQEIVNHLLSFKI